MSFAAFAATAVLGISNGGMGVSSGRHSSFMALTDSRKLLPNLSLYDANPLFREHFNLSRTESMSERIRELLNQPVGTSHNAVDDARAVASAVAVFSNFEGGSLKLRVVFPRNT